MCVVSSVKSRAMYSVVTVRNAKVPALPELALLISNQLCHMHAIDHKRYRGAAYGLTASAVSSTTTGGRP